VTHDQVEAMSMADRIVLLNAGRIEQNGTPVELYEHPANTFVARFIGTPPMNLLALEAGPEGPVIAGTDAAIGAPPQFVAGQVGIRAEHIAFTHERGGGRGLSAHATVEAIEYLGGDSLVTCRLGNQNVAVRSPGSVGLRRGDAAWLDWAPSAQHLFGADGLRWQVEERHTRATMPA
jgi:sn-glycerol 3-phosphate transport system ATP-binding protein